MILTSTLIIIAYLLGSLSSAIIVCKLMKLPDPRTIGSGNPGTTNVLRIGGKLPAILTLAGDVLKGLVPVIIASLLNIHGFALGLVALAACIGHVFPVFFKFQGGKAVATAFGAIFALSPLLLALTLATMLITTAISRYVSLGAIISFSLAPLYALLIGENGYFIPLILIMLLVIWRHKENIQRLRNKQENKLQFGNKKN